MVAVYDDQTNLFSMSKMMEDYFRLNGLNPKTLDVDVMAVMKQKGMKFHQAYKAVRPYIAEEIKQKEYDLILDIHRDSTPAEKTTAVHNGVSMQK